MDALILPIPSDARAASAEERARFRGVLFDVAPAMFIGTLDQTIVAAALPAIAATLGGFADIAWIVTAYLLAATVVAPIYGRLGDAFGRRRALLWALAIASAIPLGALQILAPDLTEHIEAALSVSSRGATAPLAASTQIETAFRCVFAALALIALLAAALAWSIPDVDLAVPPPGPTEES